MCISEQDFNAMFKSNSSHPERFSHITVLRQVHSCMILAHCMCVHAIAAETASVPGE